MNILYLSLKFIIWGWLILAITLLSKYIHPKWGGIFLVAPITTTLALIFVRHETNIYVTQELLLSAIYFIVPTFIFLTTTYLLLNKLPLFYSLLIAYIIWAISTFFIQKIFF